MHAPLQSRRLVSVTGFAFDLCDVVGMGILLDVGVTSIAPKAAVNARAKFVSVDGDTVARRILHRLVAMAGQAVSLRRKNARKTKQQYPYEDRDCTRCMNCFSDACRPFAKTN